MQKIHDLFGPGSNIKGRILTDYAEIANRVAACRQLGLKIVLLSGTFDLYHEGHARYLEQARLQGDVLIVGIDDDEKVRKRKGEGRPVNTAESRTEILCHCRHVDLVFLKKSEDPKWQLIKTVRPDILIATAATYSEQDLRELEEFCGEVMVLPPQAAKSTTAILRTILVRGLAEVEAEFNGAVEHIKEVFRKLRGSA